MANFGSWQNQNPCFLLSLTLKSKKVGILTDFLRLNFMEVLIKSGMQITQTDFSSGGCRPQDCMKMTQEYLMYFKEFSCNMAENMQARCVPRFIQCFLSIMTLLLPKQM